MPKFITWAGISALSLSWYPGVAKIDTLGIPYEAVYIEFDGSKLTQLGLSIRDIGEQIAAENQVVNAGSATFDGRRLRIAQPRAVNSVESLETMKIGTPGSIEMLQLSDIAAITRSSIETPPELIRYNGEPVFTVSASVTTGQNVVAVGKQVDMKMDEIFQQLPVGIEYTPIYRQHVVVNDAISDFPKEPGHVRVYGRARSVSVYGMAGGYRCRSRSAPDSAWNR